MAIRLPSVLYGCLPIEQIEALDKVPKQPWYGSKPENVIKRRYLEIKPNPASASPGSWSWLENPCQSCKYRELLPFAGPCSSCYPYARAQTYQEAKRLWDSGDAPNWKAK